MLYLAVGHTVFTCTHKHIYEVYVLVQIDLHIYAIHRFRYLYLALAFIEHSYSEHKFCTVKTFQPLSYKKF